MIKNQVLVSGSTIYELEESKGRSRNRWSAQIQPYVGSDADAEKIAEIIADALNTYQHTTQLHTVVRPRPPLRLPRRAMTPWVA